MMKTVTSSCERDFIIKNITKGLRLDGRGPNDGRKLEIVFGSENGCCIVILGETRVLAQVSCEVTAAKPTRPAEGALRINFELSPMADPNFRSGRMSEEGIEASRLLERCIRDSKCIDLESLCIISGLKVWTVSVDIHALNNAGNLIECASIGAISALAHFRRPDVTVIGTEMTVHTAEDHDPVPLNLHHMPITVSIAIFQDGKYTIVDPTEIEERVAEGKIVFGVNAHQEICSSHISGALRLKKETDLKCLDVAVKRAQTITQVIRTALDDDAYKRKTNQPRGFCHLLHTSTILGARRSLPLVNIKDIKIDSFENVEVHEEDEIEDSEERHNGAKSPVLEDVKRFLQKPEVAVFEGGASHWEGLDESSEESDEEYDESKPTKEEKGDESDEEVIMESKHIDVKDTKIVKSRGWFSKNPF